MTCRGPARARRGHEMAELDVVPHGAVLVRDGNVADVGSIADLRAKYQNATVEEIDGVLFPGVQRIANTDTTAMVERHP